MLLKKRHPVIRVIVGIFIVRWTVIFGAWMIDSQNPTLLPKYGGWLFFGLGLLGMIEEAGFNRLIRTVYGNWGTLPGGKRALKNK